MLCTSEEIYSGEAELIKVPGTKGSFEVLNNHAPIISTLEKGQIKIIDNAGKESFFEINNGVIEVKNNKIVVLVEMT